MAVLALGCAAEPGRAELAPTKQEAVVGAECSGDAACDRGEFCDLIVCFPEADCPTGGVCRTQTRFSDVAVRGIPDNDASGVVGEITVDRPASTLSSLWVSVQIRHTYRGDLRVVLHSPEGTELVLADQQGGSADDLSIAIAVSEFDGEDPAGLWTLRVSDHASVDLGQLLSWDLEMGFSDPTPTPDPSIDVWTNVPVDRGSAHPYLDNTDQLVRLGEFTGGAHRVRIHFTRLSTERNYDFVDVLDADTGAVLDHFTGDLGELTTGEYPTGNLHVRFSSDYSVTDWGFAIDRVEIFGAGCLADVDCGEGYACPTTRICVRAPCFQICMPEEPSLPGAEGDACASLDDCASELYCNSDRVCAAVGSCVATDDCSTMGNVWPHIFCHGYASCDTDRGQCTWVCAPGPIVCEEGETRFEDCNTCTCTDGLWRCTEQACSPEADLGEACGERLPCERGLVCDRGRADGAVCGRWDGVCVDPGTQDGCSEDAGPVCTCTGQTFSNECARVGYSADWASDGRCELSVVIPDADVEGITAHVGIMGPSNSRSVRVQVEIDHTYRGDLEVWLVAPNGTRHILTDREGRSADDFRFDGVFPVRNPLGGWTLHVADHASLDVGVLRFFNVVPESPAPTLGAACFVANGVLCDHGQYCLYGSGTTCGFGGGGTCELEPTVCAPDASPVCACNGDEYINECMAHANGASVRYDTACPW